MADEKPEGTLDLIPMKLEECKIPDRLSRWQWVNLYEPDGYEKLHNALLEAKKNASTETVSGHEEQLASREETSRRLFFSDVKSTSPAIAAAIIGAVAIIGAALIHVSYQTEQNPSSSIQQNSHSGHNVANTNGNVTIINEQQKEQRPNE